MSCFPHAYPVHVYAPFVSIGHAELLYLETTFTAAVAKSSQHIGGGKIKDTLQPRGVSVGEGIDAIKRKPNLRKKSIISE